MTRADNLVWVDLEMTGLEPDSCTIIEIASLVTGPDLEVVAEGPNIVIHQPAAVMDAMDEWNTRQHGESGLTELVRSSTTSIADAERQTLAFLREHCEPDASPLCGNSVGNDRNFIEKYMPELADFVHYRNIDVSTIKELVRRWYGEDAIYEKGAKAHRALDDIRESLAELRHYRERFFKGD